MALVSGFYSLHVNMTITSEHSMATVLIPQLMLVMVHACTFTVFSICKHFLYV